MNSTMTERQFRQELIESGMVPVCEYKPLIERFVEITKRAGLEFAPEPERLTTSATKPVHLLPAMDCSGWTSQAQRELSYRQAVERHNAYPGLANRAAALCRRLQTCGLAKSEFHPYLEQLEDALAKGPK